MLSYAFLIPLFPLLSFVLIISFGRRLPGKGAYPAIGALSCSFVLSLLILRAQIMGQTLPNNELNFPWLTLGNTKFVMGFVLDHLTSAMLVMVSLVSLLIHIYSIGYMEGDKRYPRFFAYLSLFTASMLGLVLANNLLELYFCWELVGLCSYLLIGFWFEKTSAARAGKKAFIVTRCGDLGLFIGLMLIFTCTGSLNFTTIFAKIPQLSPTILTIIAILIFLGAVGKSAQFPLHVWLPDAMEGPTPVSALIHAATMVAAGVYLIARLFILFSATSTPLIIVAYIGAFTAFFAATIALVINDIKRVLAYSTISQLGYMMLGLGVGGYTAGVFHLLTHAFFKALLFMGAGSVIHALRTNDIMEMGGLSKKMKITCITFVIGALSLAGIPPLSGFWSKDEILLQAFNSGYLIIFTLGILGAFLTAFYMFRLIFLTFFGAPRREFSPHESPPVMTGPLIVLSLFALFLGFLGSPIFNNSLQAFIHQGVAVHQEVNLFVLILSSLVALSGIVLAWAMYYKRVISPQFFILHFPFIYKVLKNKYYIDEFYYLVLVNPFFRFAALLSRFDLRVVDGLVNLVGFVTVKLSQLHQLFDQYIVDGLVNLIGLVTKRSGESLRFLQTGLVQNYMLVVLVGTIFFLVLVCHL